MKEVKGYNQVLIDYYKNLKGKIIQEEDIYSDRMKNLYGIKKNNYYYLKIEDVKEHQYQKNHNAVLYYRVWIDRLGKFGKLQRQQISSLRIGRVVDDWKSTKWTILSKNEFSKILMLKKLEDE